MTDLEYDIIDELYFVTLYNELATKVNCSEDELKHELYALLQKGWIKCFIRNDEEVYDALPAFMNNFKNYMYLVTKEGLRAHNSL